MLQLYTYTCRIQIDAIIKMSDIVLRKIYLSLYLKGWCVWEGVGDLTELQHIDPHSYCHQRCVFLVLLMFNRMPGGSAFYWLSLPHLVTNTPVLQVTDFQSSPSYIIVQSPTQSLEWHVWSSSSGNNCHAVHRSLSSGASVYECTMGFYLVAFCQSNPPTRFLLITAIGMCHFLPAHHFGMACLAGSKVNIQHTEHYHKDQLCKAKFIASVQGSLNKFPFFVWALLLIVHAWNSSPLRLQCTCTVPTTSGRPHGSTLVWACQWPSSQPLSSPQLSHNDSLWAWGMTKSHREQRLNYRDGEELSWCLSWSNSLVYCPGGNATDPIWRVLASSRGNLFLNSLKTST